MYDLVLTEEMTSNIKPVVHVLMWKFMRRHNGIVIVEEDHDTYSRTPDSLKTGWYYNDVAPSALVNGF